MNEAEWLAERRCSQRMMWPLRDTAKVLRTRAGRRKCRLFACGCCRLIWEHLNSPGLREAVEVAERYAEGLASGEELALARGKIDPLAQGSYEADSPGAQERTAASMAVSATKEKAFHAAFDMTALPLPLGGYMGGTSDAEAVLCDLLRCLFGNPFRPVTFAAVWLKANDGATVKVAQSISGERAFDRLPVLADALEDAGCTDAEILGHIRGPGPHARGCWVVDALLARK